jgi:hypothetical protein
MRPACSKVRRDGCGLIDWRVPQGSEASSFAEACNRGSASAFHWQTSVSTAGRFVVRKWIGRDSVQVDSVRETVTSREEVRPMNAVTMWVLPLVFTVER